MLNDGQLMILMVTVCSGSGATNDNCWVGMVLIIFKELIVVDTG